MDEYIDIVDKNGQPKGIALKSEAHKNGWYHNTIHLWLYTSDHRILLQQRSHKKKIYPLLWDVSVAGHIDAGETFETAAIRETEEEIGLKLPPKALKKIDTRLHESSYADGTILDYEFHQVYISELNVDLNALTPQADEVEALKLVSFTEFEDLLQNSETNSHFIASNRTYYTFVIDTIKTQCRL
ncbi:NUDIX hydrolase [Winogradskyella immobilis]|uniref:NUDIX domain-containing protein n=1 Tax=Winogradskyella immobilis TaxID=2816852 RepID=A0ABS8ESX1_9FLAO|nr:NUDIX domain-containing protein [Winogradskyella immobilis]MCC1485382.1 NUDIX domain-containing protein [Winogradskyella immobilis]MCG0017474.1 NUDIX domain-containing protein [Winogradskyella immobilis]